MTSTEWHERASALIRRATWAPSSHNTQPWRFHIAPEAIDLYADRRRALPVNDPDERELVISCGCALFNLEVAAAADGLAARLHPFPDAARPDWLARLDLSGTDRPDAATAALSSVIEHRRTCREPFAPQRPDAALVDQLCAAAHDAGARLQPLADQDARRQTAELVATGDAAQWADPAWRRELAAWLRPRRRGDGLTVAALLAPLARPVIRHLNLGRRVGAHDRKLTLNAPLLAVLETPDDTPDAWLQAGQALQQVLLTACRYGLQAGYLNQPLQVASLRPRLAMITGGDFFPQLVLRLGQPLGPIPASPRRPVEAVIESGSHISR